ncbi:MAG: tagaturonate reductase [Bacteroidota bacterium]|nr:tagaturonate reductase [Bacteroidota bacterium]
MNLSKNNMQAFDQSGIEIPSNDYFQLPEKVLQFGTGVLLRGLPDYFIDKANKQHVFNGRIVVVKSTNSGNPDGFENQDNLYTICVRGIEENKKIEKNIISASISRVLSAPEDWEAVLRCAENPDMKIIISNTTEVGIVLSDDRIEDNPPGSFPGKLLAFLHHRYKTFRGDLSKGMVVIPTELILDNADHLYAILRQLAVRQSLQPAFLEWLGKANYFCNSLVDCIVPGKKPGMDASLGYTDNLLIMTEVYRLWAIQSADPEVREILSFSGTDNRVVIAPNIESFRELKLRLLNGPHTMSCALAIMAGYSMVRQALEAPEFYQYMSGLMMEEIIPVISGGEISENAATDFARQVIDRFKNPYIDHYWLSISLQYATKMRMRNVPLMVKYSEKFGKTPEYMSLGFAAFLLFMKSEQKADGKFYGSLSGQEYLIQDDQAAYFSSQWKEQDKDHFLDVILQNEDLWGTDLSGLPGFVSAVQHRLDILSTQGAAAALKQIIASKK